MRAKLALMLLVLLMPVLTEKRMLMGATEPGSLRGRVTFAGTAPKPEFLPVKRDQNHCGHQVQSESLVVGPDGGLQNVVVSIEGAQPPKQLKQATVKLDNVNCRFVPHVQAATVGSKLELVNSDPILHNVHAYFDMEFNIGLPVRGFVVTKTITKPGEVVFKCDVHDWMSAYLKVFSHPYFAVTGRDGRFRIDAIPPGEYQVEFWHERIDPVRRIVKIVSGEATDIELEMSLGK